jgi:FkbM family methyltransferase
MGEYKVRKGLILPRRDDDRMVGRRERDMGIALGSIPWFVENKRVCVQAGGNWGYWPLKLSEVFDTVYTFEPDHECFTSLVANCRHRPNVVAFQACLGCARGLVNLWRDEDTTGNQHVEGKGIYPTLDIDMLGLPVCDLIYLDIEGMELNALMGATATIARCKPTVIFEVTKKWDKEHRAEAYMTRYGYYKMGTINRDVVMSPTPPTGDFGTKNYKWNDGGQVLVETPEC